MGVGRDESEKEGGLGGKSWEIAKQEKDCTPCYLEEKQKRYEV